MWSEKGKTNDAKRKKKEKKRGYELPWGGEHSLINQGTRRKVGRGDGKEAGQPKEH